MILRFLLALVVFWMVLRLVRLVARWLLDRTAPPQEVHPRRWSRRKPIRTDEAIDVDFTEADPASSPEEKPER